jgi:hypothetical protein
MNGIVDWRSSRGARIVVVLTIMVGWIAGFGNSASARLAAPTLTVAAKGTIALGTAAPAWYATYLDVPAGTDVDDPGTGSAGFVVVLAGFISVMELDKQPVTVNAPGAAFISPDAEANFGAGDVDAAIWRIAVVAEDAPSPLKSDAGDAAFPWIISSPDPSASNAARQIEFRIGDLQAGESLSLGSDNAEVPLVTSFVGTEKLSDGSSVDEGAVVTVGATPQSPIDITAGAAPATIGVVALTASGSASNTPANTTSDTKPANGSTAPGSSQNGSTQTSPADTAENNDASNTGGTSTGSEPHVPASGGGSSSGGQGTQNGSNSAGATDSDVDGITDDNETTKTKTDPKVADTDGDGFKDGQEVGAGTNPLDPNSHP